jgi:uncharacterized membrane protein YeaQ/YmgE (transglycosylase-associated protein family)
MCGWIIFGFLAGLVARALVPGNQKMGFIRTTLLGIAGAFVGGLIVSLFRGGSAWLWDGDNFFVFQPSGFIGAVIGAVILLASGIWLSRPGAPR